ncbi:GTP-binding protein Era [Citrobacter koseri]|nr:GTP-binding protein Era [Citrobacter koseri]
MSEDKSYCGFIAIVGRPNVGQIHPVEQAARTEDLDHVP